MRENLWHGQALLWLQLYHTTHQCLCFLAQFAWEGELALENQLVEILEVAGLEGHRAAEHREEKDAQRPDVHEESFVPLVDDDLWREISWCAALLLDHLALLDDLRYAKVADLDTLLAIQKDIVELDVAMNHGAAVDVRQAVRNLLEDEFGIRLLELAFPLDESEEISSTSVLHDHEQVLAGLKDLQEPDDIGVLYLLEQVNFLEDLPLAEVILHVVLLDRLDGHLLSRQLVHSQRDLAKGSLSNQLHELVEVESRGWQLVVLLDVLLDVLDQVVALL